MLFFKRIKYLKVIITSKEKFRNLFALLLILNTHEF